MRRRRDVQRRERADAAGCERPGRSAGGPAATGQGPRRRARGRSARSRHRRARRGVRSASTSRPTTQTPSSLQPRERRGQATDERHRQVLDGPGGRLGDRRGDVDGAVPGQHDAGRAGALGRAQQRAEVARIGDAVDGDEERAWRRSRTAWRGRRGRPRAAARPWRARPAAPRCGPRRRACLRLTSRTGTRISRRARGCRRRPRASSRSVATHTSRTCAGRPSSSSRTAWRPSTWSPPRPRVGRGGRRCCCGAGPRRGPERGGGFRPRFAGLMRRRPTRWQRRSRRCPRAGRARRGPRPASPSRSPARRLRSTAAPASPRGAGPAWAPRQPPCSRRCRAAQPAARTIAATCAQQLDRVGAAPARVGVGEVLADVAEPGRAEQRVGDRVGDDVGVAVAARPRPPANATPPSTSGRDRDRRVKRWTSKPWPTRTAHQRHRHRGRPSQVVGCR